jgi:hypothetical protein
LLARSYRERQTLAIPTCVVLYHRFGVAVACPADLRSCDGGRSHRQDSDHYHCTRGRHLRLQLGVAHHLVLGSTFGQGQFSQDRAIQRFVYYTGRPITAGDTAQALTSVGRFFAPWSGEKVLIWISAGTTILIPADELAANRIRTFPLNVHASMPYMFISSFTLPVSTYEYDTEVNWGLLQNMRSVAQETGGELCNSPLQAEACARSAEQDAREFYLLTYATHSRERGPNGGPSM